MSEQKEKELVPRGRWSPFPEMDFFGPFDLLGRPSRMRDLIGESAGSRAFAPAIDVVENDDEFVITAELPGAKRDDITVELHDGVLTLRGEKKTERDEKRDHARYVERSYGSFSRSFSLPSNADGEKLAATFKDGVLSLRIPKREEAKPRTINIQSAK